MKIIIGAIAIISILCCCRDQGIQRGSLKIGNTRDLELIKDKDQCIFGLEIFGLDESTSSQNEELLFTVKINSSLKEYEKEGYYFSVHVYDNDGKITQVLMKSSTGNYRKEIFLLNKGSREISVLGNSMNKVMLPMVISLQCVRGKITHCRPN